MFTLSAFQVPNRFSPPASGLSVLAEPTKVTTRLSLFFLHCYPYDPLGASLVLVNAPLFRSVVDSSPLSTVPQSEFVLDFRGIVKSDFSLRFSRYSPRKYTSANNVLRERITRSRNWYPQRKQHWEFVAIVLFSIPNVGTVFQQYATQASSHASRVA